MNLESLQTEIMKSKQALKEASSKHQVIYLIYMYIFVSYHTQNITLELYSTR